MVFCIVLYLQIVNVLCQETIIIIIIIREVGIGCKNHENNVFSYYFPSTFDFDFHGILRRFSISGKIDGEVQIHFGGPEDVIGGLEILHLPFQWGQFWSGPFWRSHFACICFANFI